MSFTAAPRRRLALLLVACLAAAVGGFVMSGNASATPPLPTSMKITQISSAYTAPDGLLAGAAPTALVKANESFTIRVEFFIGKKHASFPSDTKLTISSDVGTLLSSDGGVVPANEDYALVHPTFTSPVNRVGVTVTVADGPAAGLSTGTPTGQLRFDVLSDIRVDSTTPNSPFTAGIGGENGCTSASVAHPVCGLVLLPRGAGSSVLLSIGACDTSALDYAPCFVGPDTTGGAVVQTLFAQPTKPVKEYSTSSPATLVLMCDKTLCGTGAIRGLTVSYSLLGNGSLTDALPCPSKKTMAEVGRPCVDYVQSHRDGSGDTHLYLLTDRDLRGGIS
jgi:hypothetical protein